MTETDFQDKLADLLNEAMAEGIDIVHIAGVIQVTLTMFIHQSIELVPDKEEMN